MGGIFFYFDRVLPYPLSNSRGMLSRFYQQFIRSRNNITNSRIRNQNSKYLHATCFRMKVEIRLVVFFLIARNIAVTNFNTYLQPLIQWVSVERLLRFVNTIDFQQILTGVLATLIQWVSVERLLRFVNTIDFQPPSERAKEWKTNPVSFFFATIVDDIWLLYSRKTRLRAVSQCWVQGT